AKRSTVSVNCQGLIVAEWERTHRCRLLSMKPLTKSTSSCRHWGLKDPQKRQAQRSGPVTEFWSRIRPCRLWLGKMIPHRWPVLMPLRTKGSAPSYRRPGSLRRSSKPSRQTRTTSKGSSRYWRTWLSPPRTSRSQSNQHDGHHVLEVVGTGVLI